MSFDVNENISSLVDGELDATEQKKLIDKLRQSDECQSTWSRYCLISQALKRDLPSTPPTNELFSRVHAALASEPALLVPVSVSKKDEVKSAEIVHLSPEQNKPQTASSKPVVGFAVAASIALATVLGFQFMSSSSDVNMGIPMASNATVSSGTPEVQLVSRPATPVTTVSSHVDEPLYAEQSVINDGQWTRITHIGNMTLNGNVIKNPVEAHASINLQGKPVPFARTVNMENTPAQ